MLKLNIGLLSPSPDIVCLIETWLHPGILDAELGLHNYTVFRRDRHNYNNAPYGGGVLIAVKNHLKAKLVLSGGMIEELFVEICGESRNLLVGCFYTPNVVADTYNAHVQTIDKLVQEFVNHEFIFLGDYNLRETIWSNHNELSDDLLAICNCSDSNVQENVNLLMNFFSYLGMCQYFPVHAAKGYTLDLAFSSLQENCVRLVDSPDSLVPLDLHHNQVFFKISFKCCGEIKRVKNKLDFLKANYNEINSNLQQCDWSMLFASNSVEENTSQFYSILNYQISKYVPFKKVSDSTYPCWYSSNLISLIIDKKKVHKKWLQFNVPSDGIKFRELRAKCIRQSRIDRQLYIEKVEKKSKRNIKNFWNYVNSLSRSNNIPEEVFFNNEFSQNGKSACNLFAKNFELVYLNANSSFQHQLYLNGELDFTISREEIALTIKNLKESNSVGPDGLSALFVKNCSSSIVEPLYYLYQQSLITGCMPTLWKKTFITPIFKAGNKCDVMNYRPIAIIGTISKIFDSTVAMKLSELCLQFIIQNQHGFVKGRSTITNLIFYNNFIADTLNDESCPDEVKQVDAIYLDFAKAFDSVNHNLLIYKLSKFGLSGGTLKWILSYLTKRELQVRIKGNLSDPFIATSGVPQGSHLGPLLFILFINDVCDSLNFAVVLIFADDIKIFNRVRCFYDQIKLQKDLDLIYNWSCINQIKLNCAKCKVLPIVRSKNKKLSFNYSINGQILENVCNIKDLGVIHQSNFEFDLHLNATISKAYRSLGFIIRSTKEFKSHESIIHLYKTLVRPIMFYGSIIWSPSKLTHIPILESIQHKFFRFLASKMGNRFSYTEHDYSQFALSVNLESIKSLHIYHDVYFIKKALMGLVNCEGLLELLAKREVPYELRCVRQLIERGTHRNYIYNSAIFRLRRKWNKIVIPTAVLHTNDLRTFKRELKSIVNRYF